MNGSERDGEYFKLESSKTPPSLILPSVLDGRAIFVYWGLVRHDMFMSGFGGQGVLLAGTLLSHAAIIEGKNVSFLPSYGVEKRGGAANCTVVIADGDVGSPVIGNPSVGVILNQLSMDKYAEKIKPGGICIVNSSLVDMSGFFA
jgi:2-oxoglutarate ferredoxin oxidoreductase subunit gamma